MSGSAPAYGWEASEHRTADRACAGHAVMSLRHRQSVSRWRSWLRREPVFAAMFGAVGLALLFVVAGHWRQGLVGLGAVLLAGAFLRMVLPTRRVGLLAARSRAFDVTTLGVFGLMIIVVTLTVPPGS
ncbi:DUF3017 domain-containing protein [Frankia sp. Cj3]|uniref:DUF3017 domain-containing protein n=2 Tax=Frankia TaxID=1854 RepID=UPI001EF421CA|nr:DUF3017 domain-containing protein [Frankia sp. Cj3]